MKILYLAHADNYHVKNWVRVLTNRGVYVQVLGFRQNKELDPEPIQFSGFSNELRWFDFLKVSKQVKAIVSDFEPDLIFASFAPTYGLSAILAKTKIPVIVQTWSRDIALPNSLVSIKDHLLVKTVGKWVLKKVDGITTDGVECRNHLLRRHPEFGSKTLATPWGIDLEFFSRENLDGMELREKYSISRKATILTFPRGLYWYYQPEQMLRSVLNILEKHSDVHAIILGLGHEMSAETEKLMEKLKKHSCVNYFPNLISKHEMREIWSISDFFVSIPKFDGVSESVSEGRAMGAIPILNPLPSNLEQSQPEKHAFYTKDFDASDLEKVVDSILGEQESKLEKMRDENHRWIHSFANVNHTIDSLIEFFHSKIEHFKRK